MKNPIPHRSLLASAMAMAVASPAALAQQNNTEQSQDVELVTVVAKRVVKRNHVNSPAPKLVYD